MPVVGALNPDSVDVQRSSSHLARLNTVSQRVSLVRIRNFMTTLLNPKSTDCSKSFPSDTAIRGSRIDEKRLKRFVEFQTIIWVEGRRTSSTHLDFFEKRVPHRKLEKAHMNTFRIVLKRLGDDTFG